MKRGNRSLTIDIEDRLALLDFPIHHKEDLIRIGYIACTRAYKIANRDETQFDSIFINTC